MEPYKQKALDAMESLEGMRRAGPKPFFYTRLRARMQEEPKGSAWANVIRFFTSPLAFVLVLAVILITNIATFKYQNALQNSNASIAAAGPNEYSYTFSSLYNTDNQ